MRTLSGDFQAALNDPERYGVVLLTFILGASVYGIWTAPGEGDYNGVTYRGGGSLIDASGVEDAGDGSISEITLSLSESPDKGLSADILQTFYDTDWHMQSLIIEMGLRDPDTGLIIDTTVVFDGLIAQAPLSRNSGKYTIELRCTSRAYKMSESGGKYRNKETQALMDPDDTSLDDIGVYGTTLQKELKWGQA